MSELVPMILGNSFIPYYQPLKVDIELFVTRPKRTKLGAPKADIDNYLKSILDCMNGRLWEDDTQIREIYATKQWTNEKQDGYFVLVCDILKPKEGEKK